MRPITKLVTPNGIWVSPRSPEFFAALGETDPGINRVAFAVKNLGFIKLQVIKDLVIEIELHPRKLPLQALLAIQQYLLSSQVKLFRIKYLEQTWHSEISSSAE